MKAELAFDCVSVIDRIAERQRKCVTTCSSNIQTNSKKYPKLRGAQDAVIMLYMSNNILNNHWHFRWCILRLCSPMWHWPSCWSGGWRCREPGRVWSTTCIQILLAWQTFRWDILDKPCSFIVSSLYSELYWLSITVCDKLITCNTDDLITWDFSSHQVWMEACAQVLFSYGVASGTIITLGSYNKVKNNCYK